LNAQYSWKFHLQISGLSFHEPYEYSYEGWCCEDAVQVQRIFIRAFEDLNMNLPVNILCSILKLRKLYIMLNLINSGSKET